jgi:hypothetical protein
MENSAAVFAAKALDLQAYVYSRKATVDPSARHSQDAPSVRPYWLADWLTDWLTVLAAINLPIHRSQFVLQQFAGFFQPQ